MNFFCVYTGMTVSDIIIKEPVVICNNEHRSQKKVEEDVRLWPPVNNINDSRKAELPVNTVGKILNHRGYDISTIVNAIPLLYETSICIITEPETIRAGYKRHPNIAAYYHYLNLFKDSGGNEYYIRFTLFEEKSRKGVGRILIHSIFVSDVNIYKKKTPDSNTTGIIAPDEEIKTPSDLKLQHFFASVNNYNAT